MYALFTPMVVLVLIAIGVATGAGRAGLVTNTGPRGFSEILFAYASCMANNGVTMTGLNVNSVFYNVTTTIAMLAGRYGLAALALALTGQFAAQRRLPTTAGTLPCDTPTFGAAAKTELRLTAPDYFGLVGMSSGFGDLAVGMKQQLGPTPGGFDVSLVLSVSLPTGASAISSHGYDPFAQLPWSRAVSSNWTAAGMLSVYGPTVQGRRNVTGETTFLMDRQLMKTWDAFVEYVGDFPEQGGPRHLVHFGTAYKPTPHQQLDLHFGLGLSSAAVDHFIGVGYSLRWQAVRR